VCLIQIWLDRLEDIGTEVPVSWRVNINSCWVLLEVIWNGVPVSCWVINTFIGRLTWCCFSLVKYREGMYDAFSLASWAEVWNIIIDIGVWRALPEGMTNSVWIRYDHLKSIVYMLEIHFVGTGFVRWPSWDRVSILSRSCVDFLQNAQSRDRV